MPAIKVNGVTLNYRTFGSGPETVVFSHGYLMNHMMFINQINLLKERYRVIAYDHRCHGGSEAYQQPFGMYDLMEDGAALIDKLVDGPVHFVGMSTGGFVGLRLAIRRPDLIKSLTLIDTAAGKEPPAALKEYKKLLFAARWLGTGVVAKPASQTLMGDKFRKDKSRASQLDYWMRSFRILDNKATVQFGNAIFGRDSVIDKLASLDVPALIICGEKDIATTPDKSQLMLEHLPNAQLVMIPDAGHTSPVEEPAAVNAAIDAFLTGITA